VDALRARGANGISHAEYGLAVLEIISLFIDGHAGVGGVRHPAGALPFFIESTGDRFVALRPDRSGFWDSEYPFVTYLDGRPLDEWLAAAAAYASKASPQWLQRNTLSLARRVQFVREAMGLPSSDSVEVQLHAEDGRQRERMSAVPASAPGPSSWPETQSGIIDGDVGYLRLASMDAAAVAEVATWMPRFRETRGLIVDVRGNTGGSRDALRVLFPYLMAEDDPPRVVNSARYRLSPRFRADHLDGSRYMYRESWPGWTPDERAAVAQFRQTFTPQWMPPDDEFSEWHYLVLPRRTNPGAYGYGEARDRPSGREQLQRHFVSSFKGWHDVMLVDTPSGGGSARQVSTRLPISGLSLNLASMASFQWTGLLHDGNGTQPDVLAYPEPEYFLRGGRDNMLERALELLPGRNGR
jgi:hypothetical protein